MKLRWQREKETDSIFRTIKEEIEAAHIEEQQAEREGNYATVAEFRYGQVAGSGASVERSQLPHRRNAAERAHAEGAGRRRRHRADRRKWTGIPVTKMLESEVQKLIQMEELLAKRVVGQEAALKAVANAIRRSRAGLAGSQPADRRIHVSWSDRRG